MVTHKTGGGITNEYYGLSTDQKPESPPNASTFYEIDTGELYMYDAAGEKWVKQ